MAPVSKQHHLRETLCLGAHLLQFPAWGHGRRGVHGKGHC